MGEYVLGHGYITRPDGEQIALTLMGDKRIDETNVAKVDEQSALIERLYDGIDAAITEASTRIPERFSFGVLRILRNLQRDA